MEADTVLLDECDASAVGGGVRFVNAVNDIEEAESLRNRLQVSSMDKKYVKATESEFGGMIWRTWNRTWKMDYLAESLDQFR